MRTVYCVAEARWDGDLREFETTNWPNHALSRSVEAGGIRWHVLKSGSGPSLLLVHGTGASTHSWRDLLPLLARDYTVWAADLPGHGFTDSVGAGQSSIVGMSSLMSALLRELNLSPDYCVGHSAGAVILCRMSLDAHIAPRVIISINGAFFPLGGGAGTVLYPSIARLLARNPVMSRVIAWRARNPANVARVIAGTGSTLDAAGIALYSRLAGDPRHLSGALSMMGAWDLSSFQRDLPRLRTPLALLAAGNDLIVPPHQAWQVKKLVPNAAVHEIPGLGHLAHEEDPELAARQISRICREAAC
jgi:magnesium chelatase accessory protein